MRKRFRLNLDFFQQEKKFSFIGRLADEFPRAEIYLVGGAVRDLLLGREVKDFDFIVRRVKADDLENLLSELGTVKLVGKRFGVFKFIPQEGDVRNPMEIALPRKELAWNTGGYKDVEVQSDPDLSIREDLSRRDFTVNALAVRLSKRGKQKIIDPFKGRTDLNKKIIRAVGDAEKRFKEDYSRMLRGLRFACQLGFKIDQPTWQAIKRNITSLNEIKRKVELVRNGATVEQEVMESRIVPYEVIAREFLKAFYYHSLKAFDLYDDSGAFEELIPELMKMKECPQPTNFHSEGDVWTHTRLSLKALFSKGFRQQFGPERPSLQLIMAVLFHDLGKPYTIKTPQQDGTERIRFDEHDTVGMELTRKICQRLKLFSPEIFAVDPEKIAWLVGHHMLLVHADIDRMRPSTVEKYFFNPQNPGDDLLKLSFADISATIPPKGKPDFSDFNRMLKRIEELKQLGVNKEELPDPLIGGDDLMQEFNLSPGPRIGKLLQLAREEQLEGKIASRKEALKFIESKVK